MKDSQTNSSREMTKQFREIFEAQHDPEIQELKRIMRRKQERVGDRREDWGLDEFKDRP